MANGSSNGTLQLTVSYESSLGPIVITAEDVRKYLVRGGGNVTDQEIKLFLELCKYQKLNPFVGEAYPIKFGSDFQLVVGYEAYKRRAEENPTYVGRKSGIVVLRGDQVIQKEGTCLYPGETLIGGWCRVQRIKNDKPDETFKEVSLHEYDKQQANWRTKPSTMIEKVAVSQALRAAFPTDYAGLYTAEESSPEGYREVDTIDVDCTQKDEPITQEQRQQLFKKAKEKFGDAANDTIARFISEYGLSSTADMPTSIWIEVMTKIEELSEDFQCQNPLEQA